MTIQVAKDNKALLLWVVGTVTTLLAGGKTLDMTVLNQQRDEKLATREQVEDAVSEIKDIAISVKMNSERISSLEGLQLLQTKLNSLSLSESWTLPMQEDFVDVLEKYISSEIPKPKDIQRENMSKYRILFSEVFTE